MNSFYNRLIPIGVSVSHIHITRDHLDVIYGKDYELKLKNPLTQKGQFASKETVTLISEKGELENIRILGPERKWTQVELSRTDAIKLGVTPPLRDSGNHKGTPGICIKGPTGQVTIDHGVILAMRHIHMNQHDANAFSVQQGDTVQFLCGKERKLLFDEVLIRVDRDYVLDFHIDTDEANAADVSTGDTGYIIKFLNALNRGESRVKERELLTEKDVLSTLKKGEKLKLSKDTIITPLALDLVRKHKLI